MIARLILIFLLCFAGFFCLYWAIFRTRFFTTERVAEVVKTGSLTLASIASTTAVIGFLFVVDKLF